MTYNGRSGILLNLLAVIWGVALISNMAWPRPKVYGSGWYEHYVALLFTAGLMLTSVCGRTKLAAPQPHSRLDVLGRKAMDLFLPGEDSCIIEKVSNRPSVPCRLVLS